MLLFENIRQAYNSLVLNKKRTFLTMIGIIIGLSSVLAIVSIGDTVSKVIEDYMVQFFAGGNKMYFISGYDPNEDNSSLTYYDIKKYMFKSDEVYDFIESTNGIITDVDESADLSGSASVMLDSEHKANVTVKGVSSSYSVTQKVRITNGRFISLNDNRYRKPVAVISDIAAESLFGSANDAIGENLNFDVTLVDDYPYYDEEGNEQYDSKKVSVCATVIGVYEYVAPPGTPDIVSENTVSDMLCTATYINSLIGYDDRDYYVMPFVVKDKASTEQAKAMINDFAMDKFGDDPDYKYDIIDIMEELSQITNVISIITGSFVVIAAISLLVGGIGLMNTMLVSVTERTKEIGIKKALGARNSSIRTQFLFESAMICLIACAIGIFFGIFFGMILESNLDRIFDLIPNESFKYFLKNAEVHVTPSANAVVVSTLFSLAVGIIFGLYPANKGAKMQPVEALRYE